jgi:hypothetical protein
MRHFIKKMAARKWVPVAWTVLTILLLCIPGSAFPGGGFFHIPHFDKVVHIILFGGMLWWWVLYFDSRETNGLTSSGKIVVLLCMIIALGITLEFVQLNFIPNRSFDKGDIYANAAGSLLAGVIVSSLRLWRSRK